jgi:hypothetical protein
MTSRRAPGFSILEGMARLKVNRWERTYGGGNNDVKRILNVEFH